MQAKNVWKDAEPMLMHRGDSAYSKAFNERLTIALKQAHKQKLQYSMQAAAQIAEQVRLETNEHVRKSRGARLSLVEINNALDGAQVFPSQQEGDSRSTDVMCVVPATNLSQPEIDLISKATGGSMPMEHENSIFITVATVTEGASISVSNVCSAALSLVQEAINREMAN